MRLIRVWEGVAAAAVAALVLVALLADLEIGDGDGLGDVAVVPYLVGLDSSDAVNRGERRGFTVVFEAGGRAINPAAADFRTYMTIKGQTPPSGVSWPLDLAISLRLEPTPPCGSDPPPTTKRGGCVASVPEH